MMDNDSPSKTVATKVVDSLIKNGLLRADRRDALIGQIADGTMNSEDWRMEIDTGIEKAGDA